MYFILLSFLPPEPLHHTASRGDRLEPGTPKLHGPFDQTFDHSGNRPLIMHNQLLDKQQARINLPIVLSQKANKSHDVSRRLGNSSSIADRHLGAYATTFCLGLSPYSVNGATTSDNKFASSAPSYDICLVHFSFVRRVLEASSLLFILSGADRGNIVGNRYHRSHATPKTNWYRP